MKRAARRDARATDDRMRAAEAAGHCARSGSAGLARRWRRSGRPSISGREQTPFEEQNLEPQPSRYRPRCESGTFAASGLQSDLLLPASKKDRTEPSLVPKCSSICSQCFRRLRGTVRTPALLQEESATRRRIPWDRTKRCTDRAAADRNCWSRRPAFFALSTRTVLLL